MIHPADAGGRSMEQDQPALVSDEPGKMSVDPALLQASSPGSLAGCWSAPGFGTVILWSDGHVTGLIC